MASHLWRGTCNPRGNGNAFLSLDEQAICSTLLTLPVLPGSYRGEKSIPIEARVMQSKPFPFVSLQRPH
ncbi:MAG: hypothetical protein Q8Q73_19360 [Stagnimonas sp.]|nr:hypothetical protein [Stagnimonas sp.]